MLQDKVRANRYKFFSVGAIGTFMATLDGSILNVALPSIATDLDCPIDLVAWVVLAYSLTLISLMIVFGAITERKGYKFSYKFGYIFFMVGSAMCAFSDGIYFLIAARVVQAIGTAMFAAVGPAMVTTVFPPEERGKGIGMMVMMVSAGFMVGPPLGGYILGIWDWQMIFMINLPIGLFGLYMTQRYFGMLKPQVPDRRVQVSTAASLSVALVGGVMALSFINDFPLSDPRIWGLVLLSLTSLFFFFYFERNPKKAVVGLEIFSNRVFSISLGAQLMHFSGMSGVLVLIPFYMERVQNLQPSQVGMYLVILPIMLFLVAPLAGKLSDRIGYRLLTSAGMTIMALGLWMLADLDGSTENWYVAICLMVIGCGVGLFSTPNSSAMMGSVAEHRRAIASGILATSRNIGMSVGVALSTALFAYLQVQNAELGDDNLIFVTSYRPVIYVGMAFALVGVVFCLLRPNRLEASEIPPA